MHNQHYLHQSQTNSQVLSHSFSALGRGTTTLEQQNNKEEKQSLPAPCPKYQQVEMLDSCILTAEDTPESKST